MGLAAKDIRFIKTVDDGKVPAATPLYKNPVYWLIDLSLFLVFALMTFLSAKKAGAKSDLQSFRFRRSHQLARGKLRDASRMLKQGKADDFYAEVSKAVYGYFADKLNIPPQAVTRQKVEESSPDASAELLNKVGALFGELSHGRYGRAQKDQDDMKNLYDLADEVLTKYEKVKKK